MTDYQSIIDSANVKDKEKFCKLMDDLHAFLCEYNEKVNLTRITDYQDYINKHVCDSLLLGAAFPEYTERKMTICDIGCGAGFPSLVLASAYPDWQITAMDSIAKKTTFVKLAGDKLCLKNLTVITGRSNELNREADWKNRFDIVTARAVAVAKTVYNDARNFPKPNGRFILYKTPDQLAEDLPQIRIAAANKKWKTTPIFELPDDAGSRQFLYY